MKSTGKTSYFFIFIVLLGALTGSLLGETLSQIPALSFLGKVYNIGMSQPVILNLKVMVLTFGINLSMNVMSIVGIIVAIILYRKY